MRKTYGFEKFKFYLYDLNTSVIYNEEKEKNIILNDLSKNGYYVLDSRVLNNRLLVSDFLKLNKFDMKLVPYYSLSELMPRKVNELPFEIQIFLKIIVIINNMKDTIVFDDVLTFLNKNQKLLVLKYLKDNNISFINFTSDIEEVLYSKYLIVLTKNGVLIEGNTKSVLSEEKLLKRNGFALPFIYDLSLQLKAYGVVDKEFYSVDRLVNELWQ